MGEGIKIPALLDHFEHGGGEAFSHFEICCMLMSCGDGGKSLPQPPLNFYFLKEISSYRELGSPELAM